MAGEKLVIPLEIEIIEARDSHGNRDAAVCLPPLDQVDHIVLTGLVRESMHRPFEGHPEDACGWARSNGFTLTVHTLRVDTDELKLLTWDKSPL